jgi:hypothetical protein
MPVRAGTVTPTCGGLVDPRERLGSTPEGLEREVRDELDRGVGVVIVEGPPHGGAHVGPDGIELLDPRRLVPTVQTVTDLDDARPHVPAVGGRRLELAGLGPTARGEVTGHLE